MELSLDYLVNDEDSFNSENDLINLTDQDSIAIQDFIQKGPVKLDEQCDNIESLEICPSVVNPNDCKISVSDFKVLNVIGRGGYGKVFLVQKSTPGRDNSKLYAMKVLKKAKIIRNEKDTAHTKSERNILEIIRHPFLVKLHYAFQNQSNLYIVLTFCSGGELFTYLEREGTLMENQACFYISEICLAIGHLHSLGIIYRDLKPENVLLDKVGHVKLTDFGLSKESVSLTNTFCGTIEYMAPEILRRSGHGKEVDWWSLGTLLFDMLSGGPPFSQECDKEETIGKILHSSISFPKYFSPEVIRLITGLLRRNPRERLGSKRDVEDIKAHEFFKMHDINWSDVFSRKIEPPFKPELQCDTDVSCFDPNFTDQQPIMTPDEHGNQPVPDLFTGFSYVAPNVASSLMGGESSSCTHRYHGLRRGSYGSGGHQQLFGNSESGGNSNLFVTINQYQSNSPFLNESDFVDLASSGSVVVTNDSNNNHHNHGNINVINSSTNHNDTNQISQNFIKSNNNNNNYNENVNNNNNNNEKPSQSATTTSSYSSQSTATVSSLSSSSTTSSASSVSLSNNHKFNKVSQKKSDQNYFSHTKSTTTTTNNNINNLNNCNVEVTTNTSPSNPNISSTNVSPSCPIPIPHRN